MNWGVPSGHAYVPTTFTLLLSFWHCGFEVALSPSCSCLDHCEGELPSDGGFGLQVVKVAGVSLWALFREKKEKPRN